MHPSRWYRLVLDTFRAWNEDRAMRMGAALAFYSTFSLAPLLFLVIGIGGLLFGQEAARGEIFGQLQETLGPGAAQAVEEMLNNAFQADRGVFATILGIVLLFIGASGVFIELQDALNAIWKVQPRPDAGFVRSFIRDRLLSFSVILGSGFLLLISLVLSALLSAIGKYFSAWDIGGGPIVWQIVHQLVSLFVITLLFAMIFKVLPDTHIDWNDVWMGATATAVLFTVGKYLCGLYLGRSSVASAYGAAGTLVVVLLWIYYSALIVFFGAEFTRVYAHASGSRAEEGRRSEAAADRPEQRRKPYVSAGHAS